MRVYVESNGNRRWKEEWFSDIKVNVVSGPRDIYSALDDALDVQEFTTEEGEGITYSMVSNFPPVLSIQVQRVQFDAVEKRTYKSEAHLQLKELIYLERYKEGADEVILNKRRECWKWLEDLQRLVKERDIALETEVMLTFMITLMFG